MLLTGIDWMLIRQHLYSPYTDSEGRIKLNLLDDQEINNTLINIRDLESVALAVARASLMSQIKEIYDIDIIPDDSKTDGVDLSDLY